MTERKDKHSEWTKQIVNTTSCCDYCELFYYVFLQIQNCLHTIFILLIFKKKSRIPSGEFNKTMLALYELKHHCRTCLMKIETVVDGEDFKKSVQICKYPVVQEIMHLCLAKESASLSVDEVEVDELDSHMPNLCGLCFEKWQDFARHYQLAARNDEKLRKILQKEISSGNAVEKCDEVSRYLSLKQFLQRTANHTEVMSQAKSAIMFFIQCN